VQCTIAYPNGVFVNHYHGFTQPARCDRQMFRVLCERGDITLYEWVPTLMIVQTLATNAELGKLTELMPGARTQSIATYTGPQRQVSGRHKSFETDALVSISLGEGTEKQVRYAEIVQAMFIDQWKWIRDHGHQRKVTEENGRTSVAMAVEATRLIDHP